MRAMEFRNAHARKPLLLAIAISLLLHMAALFIGFSSSGPTFGPAGNSDKSTNPARPRLLVSIAKPLANIPPSPRRETAPVNTIRKQAGSPKKRAEQQKLVASSGAWAARSWTDAERADMDKFLNGLSAQPKPPKGGELSQRAIAMARQSGQRPLDDDEDMAPSPPTANGKAIEPFSLEMYFDAFVRKLNRSAAFVKNVPRARGSRKALVQISLNSDGSLKSYRVLRSADQEEEIAYIKSVIDRASPFSAFPPDIRNVRDSLSILMCIFPAHEGEGGGFSRSFGDQDCKD